MPIVPRNPMPEQEPKVRARNFLEVPLGYSPETAIAEASRCIQCKNPGCVTGCPVSVQIPQFLKLLREGDFAGSLAKIKETSSLPAVCGRVCPQETQCEAKCILGKKNEPVAVGRCERFVADWERKWALESKKWKVGAGNKNLPSASVAVIGAGPAGLTAAGDLVQFGYDVTIFEAFHKAGGVLMYGIPEFRLPKTIVEYEIDQLKQLGVNIALNTVVGKQVTVDELLNDFDAVYIAVGAGLPMFLKLPGEDLGGVYSANEFLTRSNLMKAYLFPESDTPIARGRNVCVIGGGNVAMDAARTAMRLGAETVKIIYRRSREELPARAEEVHHAEEEGIEFLFLTNPAAYLENVNDAGQKTGRIRALLCDRMELGEPDNSGRRRPIPIPNSSFEIQTDCVIVAAGALANPLLSKGTPQLELNKRGYIVADEHGRTSKKNVWAGGDIVTGAATVILAMGAGKTAAADMHRCIQEQKQFPQPEPLRL